MSNNQKNVKVFYGLVKQAVKLILKNKSIQLAFFYIEAKKGSSIERFFHVDKRKAVDPTAKFSSPKKISTYLALSRINTPGSLRSCAGHLLWDESDTNQLTIQIEVKNGVSAPHLTKMIKKINQTEKLGLPKTGLLVVDSLTKEKVQEDTQQGVSYHQAMNLIRQSIKQITGMLKTLGNNQGLVQKLEQLFDQITEYLDIDPTEATDSKPADEATILQQAEDLLNANWEQAKAKEDFKDQIRLTETEMATLADFYAIIKKIERELLRESFIIEADEADQQLKALEDTIASIFQQRSSEPNEANENHLTRPDKPTVHGRIFDMAIEECLYPELRQFIVAARGAEKVAEQFVVEQTGVNKLIRFLTSSSRLRPSIRLLLEEHLVFPYREKLEEMLAQKGGIVSEADELRRELDGSMVNDRIRKALFTVVNGKNLLTKAQQGKSESNTVAASQKKTRTRIGKKLGPIIDDFTQLVRQLEGPPIIAAVNKSMEELRQGTSELAYGIMVQLPDGDFSRLVEERFGNFNVLTVQYLEELLSTGRTSSMWSMINALGLVATPNTNIHLALDILEKLSASDIKKALETQTKSGDKPVEKKLLSFIQKNSTYAPLIAAYVEIGRNESTKASADGEEELLKKGNRVALKFYCMLRESYKKLNAAVEMLKQWLKSTPLATIKANMGDFQAKFSELANLSTIKSRFDAKDKNNCMQIITDYIDAQEHVNDLAQQFTEQNPEQISPDDVSAIAQIESALAKGNAKAVKEAIEALTPEQRKLHMAILLQQEDRFDIFHPSLSANELQKLAKKSFAILEEKMRQANCAKAIPDAENAYVYETKPSGIHAQLRKKVDSMSIKDIEKKIHGFGAVETDDLLEELHNILKDKELLIKIWTKEPIDASQTFLRSLGVQFDQRKQDFVPIGQAKTNAKSLGEQSVHEQDSFFENYDDFLTTRPTFWANQIENSIKVLIQTKEDLDRTTQLVYKAQTAFAEQWEKLPLEEQRNTTKEQFIDKKMQLVWKAMSPGCLKWLKSRPIGNLSFSKRRKKQILEALQGKETDGASHSTTPISSENLLMSKGKKLGVSLLDIERSFQIMSVTDLLHNYSNYQQLRPLTLKNEALNTEKMALEIRASELAEQIDEPAQTPDEKDDLRQRERLLETLQAKVAEHNQEVALTREKINGFTLDISPDKMQQLWSSGGMGLATSRRKSLINMVRKRIATSAVTDEGKRFLTRELPGYAVDCLMENKVLVLVDLTVQKSKDTGVQFHTISSASSLRNLATNDLIGASREAHKNCSNIEDEAERAKKREEETAKILDKRAELKKRTDSFDVMRKNATRVVIGTVSVITSIGIAIGTAGIGSAAQIILINAMLVAGKSTLIEAVRKGLEGDDFAMREAVARVSAQTVIEYLGGHLGAVAGEIYNSIPLPEGSTETPALSQEQTENFLNGDMHSCLHELVYESVSRTPLKGMLEPYGKTAIATALSTGTGSLLGSAAQTVAENEGGIKSGMRGLRNKLEEEFRNAPSSLTLELTKTILTSGEGYNQGHLGALHDSVANVVFGGSAKHTELDGAKNRFKLKMADVEMTIKDIALLRDLQVEKNNLDKEVDFLEQTINHTQKSFANLESTDEAILVTLYQKQKTLNGQFNKFKSSFQNRKFIEQQLDLLFSESVSKHDFSEDEQKKLQSFAEYINSNKDFADRENKIKEFTQWETDMTKKMQTLNSHLESLKNI